MDEHPERQENKAFFVYLRQSKKGNSVHTFEVQLRTIQQFAQQRGFPLNESNHVVKQEDASAYDGCRKGFDEMVRDLENDSKLPFERRRFAGILFFNVSRIARNAEDFLRVEQLMRKGYKILSATENIIDSASGMYFFRMVQIESIYYSDRQSSKSQSYSLHILSENPRRAIGGNGTTYGYQIKNGDIQLHPLNSVIVKRIFELREQGKGQDGIADAIQEEFGKKVAEFNGPTLKRVGAVSNEDEEVEDDVAEEMIPPSEDIDDDERNGKEDMKKKTETKKSNALAKIPNAKRISHILSGNGSVQYDGRRRCKFVLNFEEDVKLYNNFLGSDMFRFQFEVGSTFKKGENILLLNVPELRIVDPETYRKVTDGKVVRERAENGHVYNGIALCACGAEMRGKVEGKLGKIYYQCPDALKKNGRCKNTTRIEERHISLFIQSNIFPAFGISEGSVEFENGVRDLQDLRTEKLESRMKTEAGALTKLITGKETAKNVELQNDYDERISTKREVIEKLKAEIEDVRERSRNDHTEFAYRLENFQVLDGETQSFLIHRIFKWIRMDEDHSDPYRYDNPYNRRSIQYQKITSFELTPYFQELFDTNFPDEQ